MTDWADEKAREIWGDIHFNGHPEMDIAQALRDAVATEQERCAKKGKETADGIRLTTPGIYDPMGSPMPKAVGEDIATAIRGD